MNRILDELQDVENIILDESFIHFAYEDKTYEINSCTDLTNTYNNLIIIKSMSKDFGIAGIRAGYGIMSSDKVRTLLKNGYLWNVNGLNEYFFRLFVRENFQIEYNKVRKKYLLETQHFFQKLAEIRQIKVYPSMANFALVELETNSEQASFDMLINHGVYTRNCSDKMGLGNNYIRVASRDKIENAKIIWALKESVSMDDVLLHPKAL